MASGLTLRLRLRWQREPQEHQRQRPHRGVPLSSPTIIDVTGRGLGRGRGTPASSPTARVVSGGLGDSAALVLQGLTYEMKDGRGMGGGARFALRHAA